MKKFGFLFFISSLFFVTDMMAQCGSSKKHHKKVSYTSYSHNDVVDLAASNDNFTTLVAAVKAADLVETLKSDGPFTVFAPSNTAFSRLPEGTVNSLLEPSAKSTLTSILTYHVIPSKIDADALVNSINGAGGEFVLKTVNGQRLTAKIINGNPVLIDQKGNKSFISQTDIEGSNGVIHVIDTVIMPKV